MRARKKKRAEGEKSTGAREHSTGAGGYDTPQTRKLLVALPLPHLHGAVRGDRDRMRAYPGVRGGYKVKRRGSGGDGDDRRCPVVVCEVGDPQRATGILKNVPSLAPSTENRRESGKGEGDWRARAAGDSHDLRVTSHVNILVAGVDEDACRRDEWWEWKRNVFRSVPAREKVHRARSFV